MPNMRMNTMLERAELARAYMNGGSAPYQAARLTGFMRVSEMQEAIRALEREEAEKAALEKNTRFGPKKGAEAEKPAETKAEVIYPFLPPGEMPKEAEKRPRYALHTRDVSVKGMGTEKPEVQIVLLEKRHTLSIPLEMLDEMMELLQTAKRIEQLQKD